MKTILKTTALSAFLLILAGGLASCNGNDCPYGGFPYGCGSGPKSIIQPPMGQTYVFRDSIPRERLQQIADAYRPPYNHVRVVISCSKTKFAEFSIRRFSESGLGSVHLYFGLICNFPSFAGDWVIPPNGIIVYMDAVLHLGEDLAGRPFNEYVLTKLERR